MNRYPRESIEFLPVRITVDGFPPTDPVQVSVTSHRDRPTSWEAPVTLEGETGLMVAGREPGTYRVWARVISDPETPVISCGTFVVL